jgi:hypothetical protein
MWKSLKRWPVLLALVVVLGGLGLVPFQKIYDDGIWPLQVTLRSAAGASIKAASGEAFGDRNDASYVLQNRIPPESLLYAAIQNPFRGEKLTVPVPTSYSIHRSLLCDYRSFYQYNKLVVLVRYEAGNEEGRLIEIPDLRLTGEITVNVP